MIKSFKDKETEKVYSREGSNKLPRDIQQVVLRKLRMLNNVKSLNQFEGATCKQTGENERQP